MPDFDLFDPLESVVRFTLIICRTIRKSSRPRLFFRSLSSMWVLSHDMFCTQFPGSGFLKSSLPADRFYVKSVGEIVGEIPFSASKKRGKHWRQRSLRAPSFHSNDCQHNSIQLLVLWNQANSNNKWAKGRWEQLKQSWLLFACNPQFLRTSLASNLRMGHNCPKMCIKGLDASSEYYYGRLYCAWLY